MFNNMKMTINAKNGKGNRDMKKLLGIAAVAVFALAFTYAYACDGSGAKADATGAKAGCVSKDAKTTTADAKDAACPVTGAKAMHADAKVMHADAKAGCCSGVETMKAGSADHCPAGTQKAGVTKTNASGCCAGKNAAMMQKASVKIDETGGSCHTTPTADEVKAGTVEAKPESIQKNTGDMAATGNAAP